MVSDLSGEMMYENKSKTEKGILTRMGVEAAGESFKIVSIAFALSRAFFAFQYATSESALSI